MTTAVDPPLTPGPPPITRPPTVPRRGIRGRHTPRLCQNCGAPMAAQVDSCWRCGALWHDEDGR